MAGRISQRQYGVSVSLGIGLVSKGPSANYATFTDAALTMYGVYSSRIRECA
jgi:hypothetical protein